MKQIKLIWMDLDELFDDPYLRGWHHERSYLFNEFQAPRFVSDAARVVLLWSYGGTYIDLDVITLKPFPEIPNFLGRMDEKQINLAISNFTKGHMLIDMLRKELSASFDLFLITSVGPKLVTETLHRYCPGSPMNKETL
ncbi:hypothetical protein SK128_015749 [Halocaridina rubra]|uniref:Uncharacterized protein n=1 Tax=Halocaridina rubra TaxID=373956 RepID=A0AAN8XQM5_HALRR